LWFDDRLWYAIAVEFQPSSWSRGTCLNIGITWLWYPKDYWSFDLGSREVGHIPFETEEQFTDALKPVIAHAIHRIGELRSRYSAIHSAYRHAMAYYRDSLGHPCWRQVHLGMLAALAGDVSFGASLLKSVAEQKAEFAWQEERRSWCEATLVCLESHSGIRHWIEGQIQTGRTMLKLPYHMEVRLPDA
jgi:hypothetical protein